MIEGQDDGGVGGGEDSLRRGRRPPPPLSPSRRAKCDGNAHHVKVSDGRDNNNNTTSVKRTHRLILNDSAPYLIVNISGQLAHMYKYVVPGFKTICRRWLAIERFLLRLPHSVRRLLIRGICPVLT